MRVFISYAREDVRHAKAAQLALHKAGHEPFLDQRRIDAGADFRDEIRREIARADAMLFLVSRYSVDKEAFTAIELQMAEDRWEHPAGHLLPLRVDEVPLDAVPEFVKAGNIVSPAAGDIASAAVRAVDRLARSARWRGRVVLVSVALVGLLLYTLIVPLLSSFAIRAVAGLGANGLHDWYAREVRSAYKVDDAAMYSRLDYYQFIEFTSNGRDATEFRLPVARLQRLSFSVEGVSARSDDPLQCAVPEELADKGAALILLELGNRVPAFTLENGRQKEYALDESKWREIGNAADDGMLEVVFRPTETVRKACSRGLVVHVKVAVKVFKSLVLQDPAQHASLHGR